MGIWSYVVLAGEVAGSDQLREKGAGKERPIGRRAQRLQAQHRRNTALSRGLVGAIATSAPE